MFLRNTSRQPVVPGLCLLVVWSVFPFFQAESQSFTRHARWLQAGPRPSSIVTGDLTGNGRPDIVTADIGQLLNVNEERPANDTLTVLLAGPGLSYTAHRQSPLRVGYAPYAVAIANMAPPARPDIVVCNFHETEGRHLTILNNVSEDLFESLHFTVPLRGVPYVRMYDAQNEPVFTRPGLTSLAVDDFNGDGRKDIVATGWSSDTLLIAMGKAGDVLDTPTVLRTRGGPRDVAVADLNGNGKLDLTVTMYSSGEVSLWRGDGAGGFEEASRFPARGNIPHKVRVADMNGNGAKDLVVSQRDAEDSVVIFYGEGDFRFSVSQKVVLGNDHTQVEHGIEDIVVADFSRNGMPDIAVACALSRRVIVLMNTSERGAPVLEFSQEVYTYPNAEPRALGVGDFNLDGKPDIAVALWQANAVALLLSE